MRMRLPFGCMKTMNETTIDFICWLYFEKKKKKKHMQCLVLDMRRAWIEEPRQVRKEIESKKKSMANLWSAST